MTVATLDILCHRVSRANHINQLKRVRDVINEMAGDDAISPLLYQELKADIQSRSAWLKSRNNKNK